MYSYINVLANISKMLLSCLNKLKFSVFDNKNGRKHIQRSLLLVTDEQCVEVCLTINWKITNIEYLKCWRTSEPIKSNLSNVVWNVIIINAVYADLAFDPFTERQNNEERNVLRLKMIIKVIIIHETCHKKHIQII